MEAFADNHYGKYLTYGKRVSRFIEEELTVPLKYLSLFTTPLL